jgi:hypothetical protein
MTIVELHPNLIFFTPFLHLRLFQWYFGKISFFNKLARFQRGNDAVVSRVMTVDAATAVPSKSNVTATGSPATFWAGSISRLKYCAQKLYLEFIDGQH